ncbi:MAG: hypothetical protein QW255_05570, partial [Candidatus Bilamarchaeaceae archaeon]
MLNRFRWVIIEKTTKAIVKYSAWTPHNYPSFSEFLKCIDDKSKFILQIEVLMSNGIQQIAYETKLESVERIGYLYLYHSSGICRFGGMIVYTDDD